MAIAAGAAVAANLGVLTATSTAAVGQLDATTVAQLAVGTPASVASTPIVVTPPAPQAPPAADGGSTPSNREVVPVVESTTRPTEAVPTADIFEAPVSTTPAVEVDDPETARTTPVVTSPETDPTGVDEGSLDDAVHDDSFSEGPHVLPSETVTEPTK